MAVELYELLDEVTGNSYFVVSDGGLKRAMDLAQAVDATITDLELVDKVGEPVGNSEVVFLGEK